MYKIYVKLIGTGGQLACEGFDSMYIARIWIKNELVPTLEVGDRIVIEGEE